MASSHVQVHYQFRKAGNSAWTVTSWSGPVPQVSEALVMQQLREKHKGYEVELKSIKWR